MDLKIVLLSLFQVASPSKILGGYFPNWAQYREEPYTFLPSNLDNIAEKLNYLVYSHIHFNLKDFSLITTDKNDHKFLSKISANKDSLPNFKLLISIGGAEFPSESFSTMVKSNISRAAFISNVKLFLDRYGIDGVEISWKWPCSPPKIVRQHRVQSCEAREVPDGGSQCPQDAFYFLSLLKELKHALGKTSVITLAGSPFSEVIRMTPLKLYSRYIDHWHVETFGYAEAATNHSYFTAPYSPLYRSATSPHPYSINDTVQAYLDAGVPESKIVIGVPLHGSFWYVPNLTGGEWRKFGLQAHTQGKCCGPYRLTYGARGGPASNTCGSYMYSEILEVRDANFFYDKETHTMVGYLEHDSSDGWTQGGTWFSYSNQDSIKAITEFVKLKKLGGVFVSDVSEDSIDFLTREFTNELINEIYSGLKGGQGGGGSGDNSGGHICDPSVGCNVCGACCHSYLTNQFDCNACVSIKCQEQVCYPPNKCNVCGSCCTSFRCSHMQCNYCVSKKCT